MNARMEKSQNDWSVFLVLGILRGSKVVWVTGCYAYVS